MKHKELSARVRLTFFFPQTQGWASHPHSQSGAKLAAKGVVFTAPEGAVEGRAVSHSWESVSISKPRQRVSLGEQTANLFFVRIEHEWGFDF